MNGFKSAVKFQISHIRLFSLSSKSCNSVKSGASEDLFKGHDVSQVSSLKIKNPRMKRAIIDGYEKFSGPPSLKSRTSRIRYITPAGLDDAFPLAYKIIQDNQHLNYSKATKLQQQLNDVSKEDTETIKNLKFELENTFVAAEIDNPEVQYNFKIGQIDWDQPVYRYLAKKKWMDYELLVLMQRLESMAVIPDTEPTLEPSVQVKLQFPGFVNKWVSPGTILPSAVCSRPPHLVIQEFEENLNGLYTVLIVDPDTPDIENDSFNTTLHWAITNISLSMKNPVVNTEKSTELISYLPPIPEKNTGNHRYSVWVYRQKNKIDVERIPDNLIVRHGFEIREASKKLELIPVGAHLWRSHFDRTTESVRERYGLSPGRVFTRTKK